MHEDIMHFYVNAPTHTLTDTHNINTHDFKTQLDDLSDECTDIHMCIETANASHITLISTTFTF